MYSDKKLFGQGVKSFRYLCDSEKFSARNTILNDKKIFMENNYFVFFDWNEKHLYINLINDETLNKDKIIKRYKISQRYFKNLCNK